MRKTWLLLGLLASAGVNGEDTRPAPRRHVLVELFTSQG
jgi:hypothetical protein